ncbi:hypothetical protein KSP40_PGU017000 [Platanthera guangdongensis]|uniref:Uncharacterized protein n=1 Tax=Platanthera guangdongensis TaxID=2320717 RepID=A0ABR2LLR1_9ASPA
MRSDGYDCYDSAPRFHHGPLGTRQPNSFAAESRKVMLDTVGPELQVLNATGNPIELNEDAHVCLTPDLLKAPSKEILPINFPDLAKDSRLPASSGAAPEFLTTINPVHDMLQIVDTAGEPFHEPTLLRARLAQPRHIFRVSFSPAILSIITFSPLNFSDGSPSSDFY